MRRAPSPAMCSAVEATDSDCDSWAICPFARAAAIARASHGLAASGSICSMLSQPRKW